MPLQYRMEYLSSTADFWKQAGFFQTLEEALCYLHANGLHLSCDEVLLWEEGESDKDIQLLPYTYNFETKQWEVEDV